MKSRSGLPATLVGLVLGLVLGPVRAETGVTGDSVLIGQTIGLSGPVAAVAQDIAAGLAAYVQQTNKRGGIHSRRLQLKTLDDGFAPPRAGQNAKLLAEQSFVLAAPLGTPQTGELIKVTSGTGIPVLCPFTGAERLRAPFNRLLFHIRAGYRDEINKMVDQLTALGIDKIALFHQDDAFGEEGLEHLEAALRRHQLKIAARATYQRGSEDLGAAIKTLSAAEIQAVVMFSVTRPGAALVKSLRERGHFPQFLSISLNSNQDFIAALGPQKRGVGNTQVAPYPWNVALPLVKDYQRAMQDTGLSAYSYNSLEGYLCGKVIGEGLRRAGANLTRGRFITALETMDQHDFGGYEIGFSSSNHVGSRHVDLTVIDAQGRFLR